MGTKLKEISHLIIYLHNNKPVVNDLIPITKIIAPKSSVSWKILVFSFTTEQQNIT